MQSIEESKSSQPLRLAIQKDATVDVKLSTAFLFETIIADAQWTALNIGTFTILVNECWGNPTLMTMWPWRHALPFDGRSMQLALRYSTNFGLSESASRGIDGVYCFLENLADRSRTLVKRRDPYSPTDRLALADLATDWRVLCGDTISMLKHLDLEIPNRLGHHYSENNNVLRHYLEQGLNNNATCINEWGEIELPTLAQKRRQVRIPTQTLCKLHVGDQIVPANLIDVSRSGAGITCRKRLTVGQAVSIEFQHGRTVSARVAWNIEERCGLSFDSVLLQADIIEVRKA